MKDWADNVNWVEAAQFFYTEGSLTINGDIKVVICPMVIDTGTNITVVCPEV